MKIRRATQQEVSSYEGLYPLYGTVQVSGHTVYIEHLPGDPDFEIMIPNGFIHKPDCLHSLICVDMEDLQDRLNLLDIQPCRCEECK